MAGGFCPRRSSWFSTLHLVGSPRMAHTLNFGSPCKPRARTPPVLSLSLTEFSLSFCRAISLFSLLTIRHFSITCSFFLSTRIPAYFYSFVFLHRFTMHPLRLPFICPHTYLQYDIKRE
jgi:hypothetical protein